VEDLALGEGIRKIWYRILDNYRNILARKAVIVIKEELRYRFFSGTKDSEVS